MPGPGQAVVKVVLNGSINGPQTWSSGFYIQYGTAGTAPTKAFLEAIGSDINDAVVAYWNAHPKAICGPSTQLDGWSLYGYSSTATVSSSENSYIFGSSIAGTSESYCPTLTSMVQSLRTDSSGRSYRGRMYMPATAAPLAGDGHFSTGDCTSMAAATAAYLMACTAAVTAGPGSPAAAAVVASFTKSHVTPVTFVFVDDLPDVQHRREDKIGVAFTAESPVT